MNSGGEGVPLHFADEPEENFEERNNYELKSKVFGMNL